MQRTTSSLACCQVRALRVRMHVIGVHIDGGDFCLVFVFINTTGVPHPANLDVVPGQSSM